MTCKWQALWSSRLSSHTGWPRLPPGMNSSCVGASSSLFFEYLIFKRSISQQIKLNLIVHAVNTRAVIFHCNTKRHQRNGEPFVARTFAILLLAGHGNDFWAFEYFTGFMDCVFAATSSFFRDLVQSSQFFSANADIAIRLSMKLLKRPERGGQCAQAHIYPVIAPWSGSTYLCTESIYILLALEQLCNFMEAKLESCACANQGDFLHQLLVLMFFASFAKYLHDLRIAS